MKIYLKLEKDQKFNNIKELLLFGYKYYKFLVTYSDEACTIQQCHVARRSFEDLLDICKTYFPETTEKELANSLISLNKEIALYPMYCSTIKKVVFVRYSNISTKIDFDISFRANRSYQDTKGVGKYSFNDILKLIHDGTTDNIRSTEKETIENV